MLHLIVLDTIFPHVFFIFDVYYVFKLLHLKDYKRQTYHADYDVKKTKLGERA